jgi:hypothetical protein
VRIRLAITLDIKREPPPEPYDQSATYTSSERAEPFPTGFQPEPTLGQ